MEAATETLAPTQTEAPTETQAPTETEAPTETPTPTGTPEPTATEMAAAPSVRVDDQEIESGSVTIAEVVSVGPGWLVVHVDANGNPGPVIGHAAVSDGRKSDVVVEIDSGAATETLYAMLHTDSGQEGTYDFPGGDPPVQVEGQVVMEPFLAEQAGTGAAETLTIAIQDSRFEPREVSVPAGTTVVWTHAGSLFHTVTADDGAFDSGALTGGDTFEFTFDQAGTYPYHCAYHGGPGGSGMSGVIQVTGE
jgi:plastocyanin